MLFLEFFIKSDFVILAFFEKNWLKCKCLQKISWFDYWFFSFLVLRLSNGYISYYWFQSLLKLLRAFTPGLSGFWDQSWVNSALYIAFWSVEPNDFKNVIVEIIHLSYLESFHFSNFQRPASEAANKFEKWKFSK